MEIYRFKCQNEQCGKMFTSRKSDRKYCCLKCYAATPEFKARRDKALILARQNYVPMRRAGIEQKCANPECQNMIYLDNTDIKRNKKTCSRACYRKWMADRFDRHIASPVTYKKMHGYDEYLSQDELPCLVEGCNWAGDDLGLHMNLAHGITAREFKKKAGFNLNTGLLSPSAAARYRQRGNKGNIHYLNQPKAVSSRRFDYISAERKEHQSKAALMRNRDKP